MEIPMTTALLVAFLSVLLLQLWRSFLPPPSPKFPPGPRPLPLVGNLLTIRKYPSLQDYANELKRRYGPIVTMWIGSKPVIIISGPDIIREAMITQGSAIRARHQLQSFKIITDGYRDLMSEHSERYRFIRKLLISGVLSNKRKAEIRPIREQEVEILVDSFRKQLHENDGVVSTFRPLLLITSSNLLFGILIGRRLSVEEYTDLDEVMVKRARMFAGKPRDLMPWLAWLPDREGIKAQLEVKRRVDEVLDPLVEERKQALRSGKTDRVVFVDTLLGLRERETSSTVQILDSDVKLICIGVLGAGTNTSALSLEYCIANLINHPEIQEKLAREISAVAGERVVSEDDLPRLPYLQAVVKEALRRHTPTRFAPPRRAVSATKVAGYDIPLNTLVVQHLESVALNSAIWEDPLEFRPERFLNKTVDFTGSTEITMIPFGVGHRICPAINTAFLHAELIVARLIQEFQWKSATPAGQLLDMTPESGIAGPMKYPLVASLQERLMVS